MAQAELLSNYIPPHSWNRRVYCVHSDVCTILILDSNEEWFAVLGFKGPTGDDSCIKRSVSVQRMSHVLGFFIA